MVISGYVIDAVVDGGNKRRMVLIISENFPDIAADIMYGLGRGCTKLKATGMYSGVEKPVIMVIVSVRELNNPQNDRARARSSRHCDGRRRYGSLR